MSVFAQAANDENQLRWYVVRHNETGYWNFELLERAMLRELGEFREEWIPSIWARYLGSPDVAVHICSAQRNAEAFYVESSPEWPEDIDVPDHVREFVVDWIVSGDPSEQVDYFDHSDFYEGIAGESGPNFKFVGVTSLQYRQGEIDDLLSDERCDPSF